MSAGENEQRGSGESFLNRAKATKLSLRVELVKEVEVVMARMYEVKCQLEKRF